CLHLCYLYYTQHHPPPSFPTRLSYDHNQVLIAEWFHVRRGRAMGYAYLGLGLGGVISPQLFNSLMRNFGWRHALEVVGLLVLVRSEERRVGNESSFWERVDMMSQSSIN